MPSKYVGDALPGCKRCPLRNFLKGVIYTWCQYFRSKHTFIGKLPFFLVLSEYPDARNPFWISTRKGFMILPGALAAIFRRASHPHEGISCRSRWEGIKWQHPVKLWVTDGWVFVTCCEARHHSSAWNLRRSMLHYWHTVVIYCLCTSCNFVYCLCM